MPRKPSKTFTDKELEIMQAIWELGETTIKELQAHLPGTQHYNSILTIIRVLERKGHLVHRAEGRAFIYRAKVSQQKASRRVLRHLVENVFGGSASSLMLHLVDAGDLTEGDLREARARMAQRAKNKEKP